VKTPTPSSPALSSFTWSSALIAAKMLIVPSTHFHDTLRLTLVVNDYLLAMQSELFINEELAEPQI
jgi:hypothetical protein